MSSSRHVPARLLAVLLLASSCLWFGAGCGKPTKEHVDRWSGSEPGLRRIEELVADPEVEYELKVYALERLSRNGYGLKAREMIRKAENADGLLEELVGRMLALLKDPDEGVQLVAKETLLQFFPALPDKAREPLKKAIAEWAFAGLPEDADSDTVRKWFESRIGMNQLIQLGSHGVKGATLLMGHGFGVQELYAHLHEMNEPDIDRRMLAAFERLHKIPNIDIPLDHLDKIHKLRVPEAIVYLLRLYSNRALPADVRGDAFGLAIRAFRQPEIRSAPDKLLPGLYAILADAGNDDRRLAAHYILRLGGVEQLERVLSTLKDDGSFDVENYDTPRFARDICRDDVLKLRGDPIPILQKTLEGGSRLSRLLSLVCLKLSQRVDALPLLEALYEDPTPLHDLISEVMTLGRLAQNAADGLRAVGKLTQRRDRGRLNEAEYETLRALYEDELALTGSELDAAVKKRARDRGKKVRRGEELP